MLNWPLKTHNFLNIHNAEKMADVFFEHCDLKYYS